MKELNYYTQLYKDLQEELTLYADAGIVPVSKVSGAMQSIRNAVVKLKTYVAEHPFSGQAEEILFFKTIKPCYVSEQVYLIEMLPLQMKRPAQSGPELRGYYEAELKKVHEYFGENRYWYQYYLMDSGELDASLFLRGASFLDAMLPVLSGADPAFSTNGDYLWARFMAMERVRKWLEEEIAGFSSSNSGGEGNASNGTGSDGFLRLKWTGDSINLVEIAYGIWLTGQVNNGQVSITEIVEFLEHAFRVRIGKPHRRWQGIASRKRLGYTRFLDEMKRLIERRIEEEMGR